ncbi:MAG: hypothetical protein KatS3mg006_1776 [Pyrinomonadaceae bacterium]|nr:MAG: hypothetical protein KatS3mg006_1776 [Pyrinomonadaceae bacterium]
MNSEKVTENVSCRMPIIVKSLILEIEGML